MSSRASVIGVLISTVGSTLLLEGCNDTTVIDRPSPSVTVTTENATVSAATPSVAAPVNPDVDTASKAPTPIPEPTSPALWNPCGLSDSAISAAGLNAASKTELDNLGVPDSRSCRWQDNARTVELIIVSSHDTLAVLQADGKYVQFTPVTLGGRQAVEYRAAQDTHHLGCYVTTFTGDGSVAFVAKTLRVQQDGFDSCADARTFGTALASQLP
ncbi:DUF3558 domain-containing protein [Nocardia sp. NPDC059764]|uniref:DUF3558 domain-containing protein n=1 Tax=Nocardia sp. NPDC059764 TaxID=3346939 RepID=UPI0036621922